MIMVGERSPSIAFGRGGCLTGAVLRRLVPDWFAPASKVPHGRAPLTTIADSFADLPALRTGAALRHDLLGVVTIAVCAAAGTSHTTPSDWLAGVRLP